MKTQYHIYRVGKPVETAEIEWPKEPGYRLIKELMMPLLDGAELEHVTVLFKDEAADMFVDEISALKALPRNDDATAIYRANWLKQHPSCDPETLPAIYGTAILFGRRVWF